MYKDVWVVPARTTLHQICTRKTGPSTDAEFGDEDPVRSWPTIS